MPKLALFDDRRRVRRGLEINLEAALPKGWSVVASRPLRDVTSYVDWILREDVQVLVIDWVLDEQGEDVESPVSYKGDSVVAQIRKRLPEFPVFVITAHEGDEDLQDHLGDVEAVFTRHKFTNNAKELVKPMLRAGERFAARFVQELARLSELAAKAASGSATGHELKELRVLQTSIGLISDREHEGTRSEALTKFENALDELEAVTRQVRNRLKRKRKKR